MEILLVASCNRNRIKTPSCLATRLLWLYWATRLPDFTGINRVNAPAWSTNRFLSRLNLYFAYIYQSNLFPTLIFGMCFSDKCDVPLGLEDGRTPDPMFRASSSYNFYCAARNARLHQRRAGRNGGAWCSRQRNNRQWLQVDFGTDAVVTRVCTQGRHNSDQWVTSYYVSFSSRGQRFITYKEGRRTKVSTSYYITVHLVHGELLAH